MDIPATSNTTMAYSYCGRLSSVLSVSFFNMWQASFNFSLSDSSPPLYKLSMIEVRYQIQHHLPPFPDADDPITTTTTTTTTATTTTTTTTTTANTTTVESFSGINPHHSNLSTDEKGSSLTSSDFINTKKTVFPISFPPIPKEASFVCLTHTTYKRKDFNATTTPSNSELVSLELLNLKYQAFALSPDGHFFPCLWPAGVVVVVCGGLCWCVVVCGGFWWFVVVCWCVVVCGVL